MKISRDRREIQITMRDDWFLRGYGLPRKWVRPFIP